MRRIILLFIIGFLASTQLYSQKDLPVFAQYGECFLNAGNCNDVIIKDNIAYLGSEAGLLILDISDPANPEFINCYYIDGYVYKIFTEESIAFVTAYNSWTTEVSIIDISDLNNPTLINSFETGSSSNNSIFACDDLLFLGMDYSGLFIYDVSDLLNPTLITELPDIEPDDMVVRDDYIYMVADYWYFGIVDISVITDPELLCWIGDYSISRSGIDIQGDYAYVAGKTLDIFDITDPSNPNQLCEFETELLNEISVIDSICYSLSDDSIYVINIEDPSMPVIHEKYHYHGNSLDINNDLIVVSKARYNYKEPVGLGFFNIDSVQQITLLTEFVTDKANEVYVSGNYAYVANGYNGLHIINVIDPSNPMIVSTVLEGLYVTDAIVENDYAYIRYIEAIKDIEGLIIVDISNPVQPVVISSFKIDFHSFSLMGSSTIEKYNDYIYIGGDGFTKIHVINVSDPYNPEHVGLIGVNDWCPDIEVFDEHLYVAGYWGGLEIFDLADPVNPQMIGYHPLGLAIKISIGENMAFIGGALNQYSEGIEIFNVTNLSNPTHVGTYEIYGTDMQCTDNYLIAVNRTYQDISSSIHVIDMADISNPVLMQEITDVAANRIYYKDERIYAVEDFRFKIFGDSLTVSSDEIIAINSHLELSCYPNPSKSKTTVKFHIEHKGFVRLSVYNSHGEFITKLINKNLIEGTYCVVWEGINNSGNKVPPGVYIISLLINNTHESEKLIITRK